MICTTESNKKTRTMTMHFDNYCLLIPIVFVLCRKIILFIPKSIKIGDKRVFLEKKCEDILTRVQWLAKNFHLFLSRKKFFEFGRKKCLGLNNNIISVTFYKPFSKEVSKLKFCIYKTICSNVSVNIKPNILAF